MAALSVSTSVSPSRCTVAPPSASKPVVSFGNGHVNGSHSLATTFYESDSNSSGHLPSDRQGSDEDNDNHVERESGTSSFDDDYVNLNGNAHISGDGGPRRFLTAKYKKKKMGMVRRRIEVEDWIDLELKRIYDLPEDSYDTYDAELDLDELLEIKSDNERIEYIKTQLSNAPKSAAEIDVFVQKLMPKMAAL